MRSSLKKDRDSVLFDFFKKELDILMQMAGSTLLKKCLIYYIQAMETPTLLLMVVLV